MNKKKEECPNLEYRIAIACCKINRQSCGQYGDFQSCKIYKTEKGMKYNLSTQNGESISFFCYKCVDSFCTCCSGDILFECKDCGYALCEKHNTNEEIKECPKCKSKNIFYNEDLEEMLKKQ